MIVIIYDKKYQIKIKICKIIYEEKILISTFKLYH